MYSFLKAFLVLVNKIYLRVDLLSNIFKRKLIDLLFHMTQLINRNNRKSHHAKK